MKNSNFLTLTVQSTCKQETIAGFLVPCSLEELGATLDVCRTIVPKATFLAIDVIRSLGGHRPFINFIRECRLQYERGAFNQYQHRN